MNLLWGREKSGRPPVDNICIVVKEEENWQEKGTIAKVGFFVEVFVSNVNLFWVCACMSDWLWRMMKGYEGGMMTY